MLQYSIGSKLAVKPDLTQYRKLNYGEAIELNDLAHMQNSMNNAFYEIINVTATQAHIKFNEDSVGKLRRISGGEFTKLMGAYKWDTTYYTIYRKK